MPQGAAPETTSPFDSSIILTLRGPREGMFTEQADYFGKGYTLSYDWSAIRTWFERAAAAAEYNFEYSITGRDI